MGQNISYFNNYLQVLTKAKNIAKNSGYNPDKVNVLVASKYASVEQISALMSGGNIEIIAESRLQESLEKWASPLLRDYKVKKFFIGHLQTNKAAKVIENFDFICSLDSLRLAKVVDTNAQKLCRQVNCLIQIKLTDRKTQGGIPVEEAADFIKAVKKDFKHINLKGLMAIAPDTQDEAILRAGFRKVKQIFDAYFSEDDYLSLGMSEDYEIAVSEGSNLPRIGSAVFK